MEKCHISIDPSSTAMGIAVFDIEGKFVDSFCLKVSDGICASMRLYYMRIKFEKEWETRYGKDCMATYATCENLPPSNFAVLANSAGAIFASGKIAAPLDRYSYVGVQSWKSFCRRNGCKQKDPKGREALKQIGWGYDIPKTDDEADAILIHLAHKFYTKGVYWLSPLKWVRSWYEPKPKKKKKVK
jgi:Holliday junction resolvasome RuvABC endonuclease subunit